MTTIYTPAQLEILDMMSFVKSPDVLAELKQVISDFFAKQVEKEVQRLWDSGDLNEDKVESYRSLHERTPYR